MDAEQKRWFAWGAFGILVFAAIVTHHDVCRATYLRDGLELRTCADGAIRQTATLSARGLRRGASGRVQLAATAHYTTDASDDAQRAHVRHVDVTALTLVDARHASHALAPAWDGEGAASLTLPEDLADGDYTLHAEYTTRLGSGAVDLAIPLYTPAAIHVITDRPLYEPGNTIKFRAVVLRARDLAPLDDRPGTWVVTDPTGDPILEERTRATAWGVVAGSFPLDRGAPPGTYKIAYRSDAAVDEIAVEVKPFTLPRFRIDAAADQPFYRAGDAPTIAGAVVYASGAPVANAQLDIQWSADGAWPPPTPWLDGELPRHATTAPTGRFALALPKIPSDLIGQAHLIARIAAVDAAGDRVEGVTSLTLSQDAIVATAVTELEDGLIGGQNNRVYVRVATPAGRVLAGATLHVQPAWDRTSKGFDATLDEDGVAALQLDPGAPVNVLIPAAPYRPAPRPPLVALGGIEELVRGEGAPLADRVEIERWLAPLGACAKLRADDDHQPKLGVRVDRTGALVAVAAPPTPLAACVAREVRAHRLPAGGDRLYALTFEITDPPLARIGVALESTHDVPGGLDPANAALAREARDCLPTGEAASGGLPAVLAWHTSAKSRIVTLGPWLAGKDAPDDAATRAAALACVQRHVGAQLELAEPATGDALGFARFTVAPPEVAGEARPQPTMKLGYELAIAAREAGAREPATTILRVWPGTQPALRLRVSQVVAKPGDTITAQLLRGPSFRGTLPDKLEVEALHVKREIDVDRDSHVATFAIDPKVEGWIEVRGGGARALVYVRPQAELAVAIAPAQPSYRPGDQAHLAISTTVAGRGSPAAVGLIGVDESLAQLVPLPGPDDLARVRPKVTGALAFGLIDGQALALGRIRGANAAAATVLRVSAIPPPPALDALVSGDASTAFDPIAELTDRFYVVLAELHAKTRAWEASAPASEVMRPATMARLWNEALDAVAARGERVDDAYGRRLRLARLPGDLLALTDPRLVVVHGTRLPEDVENWVQWVRKEQP